MAVVAGSAAVNKAATPIAEKPAMPAVALVFSICISCLTYRPHGKGLQSRPEMLQLRTFGTRQSRLRSSCASESLLQVPSLVKSHSLTS